MYQRPLITIITCFLNEGQFLSEAVESVLRQEYSQWELLLIDDGSTDHSTEIAKRYAHNYPEKIFYLEHQSHANKGLSASRNLGLSHSSGEFISFLDGDDEWSPDFLLQIVAVMQNVSVSMVCEATEYWHQWNGGNKKNTLIPVGTMGNTLYQPPQLMLDLYPLGKGAAPCLCGILVKKEILVNHDGFNEEFKGMYEDQVFLSKMYLNETVYISKNCNNRYRQRPGSLVNISHTKGTYLKERKKFLEWLEKYLENIGSDYHQVKSLLKKSFFPYRHPLLYGLMHSIPAKGKRWGHRLLTSNKINP